MFKKGSHIFLIFLIATHGALAKQPVGQGAISQETETFIRSIQKELHMESYVLRIKPLAEENAMVSTGLLNNRYTLSLNETWFKTFSHEAQRFIIGHELMHIQRKHVPKTLALSLAWPSLASVFVPLLRNKTRYYGDIPKTFFMLWYSRVHEKEADLKCAKKLHCAQGGIEFFQALLKSEGKCFRVPDAFLTHPSHTERIKRLRKLMASPEYQAA